MAEENRPRLGRGLAALLGDAAPEGPKADKAARHTPVEFLRPNPRNPRKAFSDERLEELAASIREKGLIQPIVVRPLNDAARTFEIIAGERRWRAAQLAGLHEVPVVVLNVSERESLELAIVENVQRTDLNAIEEARGYGQLIEEFSYTQSELGKIIGKSRSHIANMLRLLSLPAPVLKMVESEDISAGHARALLSFDHPEEIAHRIVSENLNVRDVEKLARAKSELVAGAPLNEAGNRSPAKDPNLLDLEKRLSDAMGMKIQIRQNGTSGEMRIHYRSLDQLESVCERLQ